MGNRLGTYMGMGGLSNSVEHISLASTRITLTDDQQGKLLILDDSTGSTVEIALPAPEAGMCYTLYFSTGAVSAVTKVLSTAFDIKVAGSTAKGAAFNTTAETGMGMVLYAISDYRWVAWGLNPLTAMATATS